MLARSGSPTWRADFHPCELHAGGIARRDGDFIRPGRDWNRIEPEAKGGWAGADAEFVSVRELECYLCGLEDDRSEHETRSLDVVGDVEDRPERRLVSGDAAAATTTQFHADDAVLEGLSFEPPRLAIDLAASNYLFLG